MPTTDLNKPGRGEPLRPREREVLAAMARGKSNRQIATQMLITVDTVKTHGRRVFRKLGVASRFDAVAAARRAGLLADPCELCGDGGAEQLARVRALHRAVELGGGPVCVECSGWNGVRCLWQVTAWPCRTAEAVGVGRSGTAETPREPLSADLVPGGTSGPPKPARPSESVLRTRDGGAQ